jgi:hypothetical protein
LAALSSWPAISFERSHALIIAAGFPKTARAKVYRCCMDAKTGGHIAACHIISFTAVFLSLKKIAKTETRRFPHLFSDGFYAE